MNCTCSLNKLKERVRSSGINKGWIIQSCLFVFLFYRLTDIKYKMSNVKKSNVQEKKLVEINVVDAEELKCAT